MKVSEVLQEASRQLHSCGVEESNLDARLLLQFVTGMTRSDIILGADQRFDSTLHDRFQELIRKRCSRIPLSYITESREFWSLDFYVSPAVLVPRPETEFLLEHVLKKVAPERNSSFHALDMCTGSGVIAAILEKELQCCVTAIDISQTALYVAQKNFTTHCMMKPHLICSDLFSAVQSDILFDLIVSNPPYIEQHEIDGLQPEVAGFEPHLALDGGKDGLGIIRRIIDNATQHLVDNGWLFIEIGSDQRQEVLSCFENMPCYGDVLVFQDYSGRDRIVQAQYLSSHII